MSLFLIFNQSFKTGVLPYDWKLAEVIAVHNKVSKTDRSTDQLTMGGGTGGYRGYMYPPPFLEGGYKRVQSAAERV